MALQRGQFAPKRDPQVRIEAGKWFVEQQQPWRTDQGARERDALLLSPGQLVWIAPGERRADLEHCQNFTDPARTVRLRQAGRLEDEIELFPHGQVRPQREILKHEPDAPVAWRHAIAPGAGYLLLFNPDLPIVRGVEASDETQQRRLSTAARPDQDYALARIEIQRDRVDSTAAAELSLDAAQPEEG